VQTAVAAAVAWWVARRVLSDPHPLFAPIVAVIALGFTTGQRGRAAVQTVLGVAVGIAVAVLVAHAIGAGGIQIAAVVLAAMVAGLAIGTSSTFVNQAAISGVIVAAAYRPHTGLSAGRLLEAVVGGGIALLFSQVLFPVDPVERVRQAAARLLDALAGALTGDADPSGLPGAVRDLDAALEIAAGATRLAPARRRAAGTVGRFREARPHLALASASAASLERILARAGEDAAAVEPALRAVAALAGHVERALLSDDALEAARRAAMEARARVDGLPQEPLTAAAARLTLEAVATELAAAARVETP
jgi:hypothetical protein